MKNIRGPIRFDFQWKKGIVALGLCFGAQREYPIGSDGVGEIVTRQAFLLLPFMLLTWTLTFAVLPDGGSGHGESNGDRVG